MSSIESQPAIQDGDDTDLTKAITSSTGASPVRTILRTDDRVLARITDGIYRQPGSAIRELVSNAYDADATHVVIKTDRPRFESISIEDDGLGMSPSTVAHLVRHIGGSTKRTTQGVTLGVTNPEDLTLSPSGRKLIGRIGIGLFSVAQLTDRFQIITKTQGDPFRTIATVVLKLSSDDLLEAPTLENGYEAGRVNIWREPAIDEGAHGTSIVLTNIRPQTRETLQSRNLWLTIDTDQNLAPEDSRSMEPPRFHIGRVDPANSDFLLGKIDAADSVPWGSNDTPELAFKKLVDATWTEARTGAVPNIKLEQIFDYYLRMVWLQLGLAIPARYVDGHPFDIQFGDSVYIYELTGNLQMPPKALVLGQQTIRQALNFTSGSVDGNDFQVIFDDLLIQRPLRFRDLPTTSNQIRKPIFFVGQCREEFANVPIELSSGPLEFDAYLMWAPKIVPTEHQGVLIRIHGSSGTLFDPTFMRYQVSEQTRLRQITCEIFVRCGLEGALNIDRESFNYAHPHVVYVTKWLHVALRRFATVHKRIGAEVREEMRQRGEVASEAKLDSIVSTAWKREGDDDSQVPPSVKFVDLTGDTYGESDGDEYRFQRTAIFGPVSSRITNDRKSRALERKLGAVVQLLAAYNLLDGLSNAAQERFVANLREILEADEE